MQEGCPLGISPWSARQYAAGGLRAKRTERAARGKSTESTVHTGPIKQGTAIPVDRNSTVLKYSMSSQTVLTALVKGGTDTEALTEDCHNTLRMAWNLVDLKATLVTHPVDIGAIRLNGIETGQFVRGAREIHLAVTITVQVTCCG